MDTPSTLKLANKPKGRIHLEGMKKAMIPSMSGKKINSKTMIL